MWSTHKFGGTSVQNADCFRRVASIVKQQQAEGVRLAVVVSAMGGKPKVTQLLLDALQEAVAGNGWDYNLRTLRQKHEQCLHELGLGGKILEVLNKDFHDLDIVLRTASLLRYADPAIEGYVAGFGEQWSALIMNELLGEDWDYVDARKVLRVMPLHQGQVSVCWAESSELMDALLEKTPKSKSLVITGYIASSAETKGATTLGRDGSDHSASIFGVLLKSTAITIWTDVSGVMSADPRRVKDAYVLERVSYAEAAEMAFFGAKVIHPKTMTPAADHNIPLFIKNTFSPEHPGTVIMQTCPETIGRPEVVCGFSTVDGLALMNVEGTGMIGVPGVTQRVFGVIAKNGISVPLIAQASSEQSISFAIPQESKNIVHDALVSEFREEIRMNLISGVSVISPCSIVAVVGDGMPHFCGLSGQFFSALGKSCVNVLAIAQGPTERNVSAVVEESASATALQAVHSAFLSKWPIDVAIIGSDSLVAALSEEIRLLPESHVEFRIQGTLPREVTLDELKAFTDTLTKADATPHRLVIDMSTDFDKAMCHTQWLDDGLHVITSNIQACGKLNSPALWAELNERQGVPMYSHDVAVSNSVVPILSTLKTLRCSGDVITAIDGIFSPTISFMIAKMEANSTPREQAVRDAELLGMTAADLELDLSGALGAMKMLACGREMGCTDLTIDQLTVSPFPPGSLPPNTSDGKCWRYIGRIRDGSGTLQLEEVEKDHPLARVRSGVAMRIFTRRMPTEPLVLEGPITKRSTAEGILAQALNLRLLLDGVWSPKHTATQKEKERSFM